jgi:hypothetical protein
MRRSTVPIGSESSIESRKLKAKPVPSGLVAGFAPVFLNTEVAEVTEKRRRNEE